MKDPNGEWTAQPPSYDPIVAQDGTIHNLNEYMEIHSGDAVPNVEAKVLNAVSAERLGVVVNENQLQHFFAHASSVIKETSEMSTATKALDPAFQGAGQKLYPYVVKPNVLTPISSFSP
ncbi:hypothetical protein KSS87_020486 [Heliosperma pusillum]|nr:hypothetical protein KSS87_020486 [Heliosperma pusillum]